MSARGDTIFALSSGRLPAGVAVVRVSGPAVPDVVASVIGGVPPARRAVFQPLRLSDGTVLDRGLTIFFSGPASFTGEDCVEFHLHGGKAVVNRLLAELGSYRGLRAAEPGEFTQRAFLNGKVDLTGAEALADLITAETEAQRRFAVMNGHGLHRQLYEGWRRRLIHARAMIEAELDFADEGDVPGSVSEQVWQDVGSLIGEIGLHMEGYRCAEIIRDGFQVVILGAPNAGKSSLLNALARRDVAIVSDEPGTTRDLVEVNLDLDGVKVVLTDTAGLRDLPGRVEAMGVQRALNKAREADLILHAFDLKEFAGNEPPLDADGVAALRVGTKRDLCQMELPGGIDLAVSSVTGEGVGELLSRIGEAAASVTDASEIVPFRARHVGLLEESRDGLRAATNSNGSLELRAEELRLASDSLGRIAGAVDVEDLLGEVFSNFCIGK